MKRKNTFVFEYGGYQFEIISFKYEKTTDTKYIRFKCRQTKGQIRKTFWSTHFGLKDEKLQTNDIDLLIENVESNAVGKIPNFEIFKWSIVVLK